MSLDKLYGKNVEINFVPKVEIDKNELAARLKQDWKSLSPAHTPHCIAMAKYIIGMIEQEMVSFVDKIENGNISDRPNPNDPSPRQKMRQDGAISTQLIGGVPHRLINRRPNL